MSEKHHTCLRISTMVGTGLDASEAPSSVNDRIRSLTEVKTHHTRDIICH